MQYMFLDWILENKREGGRKEGKKEERDGRREETALKDIWGHLGYLGISFWMKCNWYDWLKEKMQVLVVKQGPGGPCLAQY